MALTGPYFVFLLVPVLCTGLPLHLQMMGGNRESVSSHIEKLSTSCLRLLPPPTLRKNGTETAPRRALLNACQHSWSRCWNHMRNARNTGCGYPVLVALNFRVLWSELCHTRSFRFNVGYAVICRWGICWNCCLWDQGLSWPFKCLRQGPSDFTCLIAKVPRPLPSWQVIGWLWFWQVQASCWDFQCSKMFGTFDLRGTAQASNLCMQTLKLSETGWCRISGRR